MYISSCCTFKYSTPSSVHLPFGRYFFQVRPLVWRQINQGVFCQFEPLQSLHDLTWEEIQIFTHYKCRIWSVGSVRQHTKFTLKSASRNSLADIVYTLKELSMIVICYVVIMLSCCAHGLLSYAHKIKNIPLCGALGRWKQHMTKYWSHFYLGTNQTEVIASQFSYRAGLDLILLLNTASKNSTFPSQVTLENRTRI